MDVVLVFMMETQVFKSVVSWMKSFVRSSWYDMIERHGIGMLEA